MRIGRIHTRENALADISHVVAVGVFEEDQVRGLSDQDSTVPELKACGVMEFVSEGLDLVSLAVVVCIFQDDEFVIHFILGFPVRIARPDGDEESSFGVERHLHRIGHFREHGFIGKQVDLEVGRHLHLGDGVLTVQVRVGTAGQWAGLVGDHGNKVRRVGVVHLHVATLSHSPDAFVAIGGHDVENFHLAVHHHSVGLSVHELEVGTATVNGVSISGSVAVVPEVILVQNRGPNLFKLVRAGFFDRTKEAFFDHFSQLAIAFCGWVDAVDGQRLGGLGEKFAGGAEQVHVLSIVCRCNFFHCIGIHLQTRIMCRAIRKVRILGVFKRNGREDDNTRGRFAIVLLALPVLDLRGQIGLELLQTGFASVGFVVAKESENYVGFDAFQPCIRRAEIG